MRFGRGDFLINNNTSWFIGRLAQDIELRYTTTGKAVATFSIAVQKNEKVADFIQVVAWEKLAEEVEKNLTKGHTVFALGRIGTRFYEDNLNQKRKVTELVAEFIAKDIMRYIPPDMKGA